MINRRSICIVLSQIWFAGFFLDVATCGENVPVGQISVTNSAWFFSTNPAERFRRFTFSTKAYRKEAVRLILQEANQVAAALRLPEALPITETNLVEWYVSPIGPAQFGKRIGTITTSNYVYCVSVDRKLSFVQWLHQEQAPREWAAQPQYSWPISLEDTNAAYQLATNWLIAASMDVNALNKDCNLYIRSAKLKEEGTNAYFLPVYGVYWVKGPAGHGSVASVELFLPTKTLMQLRVEDSKYILRKPVIFTNLDALLSQTNDPVATNGIASP